jgi:hypothetical protein
MKFLAISFFITTCMVSSARAEEEQVGHYEDEIRPYLIMPLKIPSVQEQIVARQDLFAYRVAEKDLEQIGLRITRTRDWKSKQLYFQWDKEFIAEFWAGHSDMNKAKMVEPLKKFARIGETLLRDWGARLELKGNIEREVSLAREMLEVATKPGD